MDNQTGTSWWGRFRLNIEQSKQWSIGALSLIIHRLNNEWQIAFEHLDDCEKNNNICTSLDTDLLPESLKNNSRYVLSDTSGILNITPLLADRQIISRPVTPFNLAAGEEVTLYISSSIWLEISIGETPKKTLMSIPVQRLSDTWFGSSTLEGELCYASNTHCRMNLDELPYRAHRAITPVLICNQANTTLVIERINLPAPFLNLFNDRDNQLWTPKVTLVREKDGDMASLKIETNAPDEANEAIKIGTPHKKMNNGALFRAFNAVFN